MEIVEETNDNTFATSAPTIIDPNDMTVEEYEEKFGYHKPWIHKLEPVPGWVPRTDEPPPKFEYGPMYPVPIHNLKHELSLPLIDEAYDAIESVVTAASGSGEKVRISRESANHSGNLERMGNKSNAIKFRSHIQNARYSVDIDRATNWTDQPLGL